MCFNHPMVKVKAVPVFEHNAEQNSFNHPMVKVKGFSCELLQFKNLVSTTLWWKLKKSRETPTRMGSNVSTTLWWKLKCVNWVVIAKQDYSFNHPMVKVKVSTLTKLSLTLQSFNHPMVKVKVIFFLLLKSEWLCFNHPMVKVKGA